MTELDLSRKVCHVCGGILTKNSFNEKEWCVNPLCQIYEIKFNIPYKESAKVTDRKHIYVKKVKSGSR